MKIQTSLAVQATAYSKAAVAPARMEAGTARDAASAPDIGSSSAAAGILAGHDLHNISWDEMQQLGRQLYDAGVLSGDQLMDFTAPYFVSPSLGRASGEADQRAAAAQKVDYPAMLDGQLQFMKQAAPGDTTSIAYMQRVLNMFSNLALIQSGG